MLLLALSVMPLLVGIVKENIMKRYIDNDKYSDTMRWKMRGSNSLSKIIDDLLWASDSDWILDDGDNVIVVVGMVVLLSSSGFEEVIFGYYSVFG